MSRIACLFTALALALLANQATAQSSDGDITFSLDRENFTFGREVLLAYPFDCNKRYFSVTDVEDDGAGQLAFTLGPFDGVIIGCIPVRDPSIDLRSYFELTPGDYSLTVRQTGGDQQFAFTVRDSVLDGGPAQTGSWYDPAQDGQGLTFEFLPDKRVIASWYAYDNDGENLWLIGTGTYDGDQAVFEMFQASGEGFPPNYDPDSHELEPWGEMTFVLEGCNAGTLSWTSTDEDFDDGEMPLMRLSPLNGLPCLDDERESDSWNTVNLLAEDPKLDFDLLNVSADGSGDEDSWNVAFEDLPEALGNGRALTARPGAAIGFTSFYVGTYMRGSDRTEFRDTASEPPYAMLAELTVALPGELACDNLASLNILISFREFAWDSASEEVQQPVADIRFDEDTTLPLGSLAPLRQDDCSTVDDYLVRTFVSPAVLTPFDARWVTLAVDLSAEDLPEGNGAAMYLLDFRVRGRESAR